MSLSMKGNVLLLDDARLTPEIMSPRELNRSLVIARLAILDGIHDYYHFMREKYPDNTIDPYVPVSIMSLGDARGVLTPLGHENNTSLHYDRMEISEDYRDYMDEIAKAAFVPFVRSRLSSSRSHPNKTLLSLTTMSPVAEN